MKSVWLLTGLLLTALSCSAMPMGPIAASPSQCCFVFIKRAISPSMIESVVRTSSRCSQKGFIVTTRKGNKVCAQDLPAVVTDLHK